MTRPLQWRAVASLLAALALGACDLVPTAPAVPHDGGIVSVGGLHVCRVTPSGATYCWGNNIAGQVGDGSRINRGTPARVSGSMALSLISAGLFHTCGIDAANRVYCWGANDNGQLGDSTAISEDAPIESVSGYAFVAVSAGGSHTCALTLDGSAYCWGSNAVGQLGVRSLPPSCGGGTCTAEPVAVAGNLRFTQIAAGQSHTCGLTPDGAAYCWGLNSSGQVGSGSFGTATTPVVVAGNIRFRQLSAGGAHTCGLDDTGRVYCWGLNGSSQLGAPSPTEGPGCCSNQPLLVAAPELFRAVSAGGDHTCAITPKGRGYCWGRDSEGQLGNGDTFNQQAPQMVLGDHVFVSISAGDATTCAVTQDNMTYCWGDNLALQLGIGPIGIFNPEPQLVRVPSSD